MTKQIRYPGMVQLLSRKLIPLSTGIALLIAVLAPVTFWIYAHQNLRHTVTLYAEDLADQLRQVALDSPALWKYQTYKFISITEGFHPSVDVSGFRVLDEKGELISGHDYQKVSWGKLGKKLPFTEEFHFTLGTAPIIFNDRQVGSVEVLANDTSIVRSSVLLFCFWLFVGIVLAFLVYRFPVNVVRKMAGEIDDLVSTVEESEERYRSLVEESLVGVYIIVDGIFRYVNPKMSEIFGWTNEELLAGKGPVDLTLPEDWPIVEQKLKKRITGEISSINYEFRGVTKDNRVIFVEVFGCRITYQGQPAVIGTLLDISERKLAEEALRSSTEFSRTVMDSIDDAISIVNASDFRIMGCNAAFLNVIGLTVEEVVGKECHEVTHHQSEPCCPPFDICPLRETVASGNYSVAEHTHFRENGDKFYAEVSTSPVFDENGKVMRVVHVSRNITERKRIEEELLKAKSAADEANRLKSTFLANMSHEIRTPMNGVIGLSELLLDTALDNEQTEYVQAIQSSSESLLSLINDILDFSKIEARKMEIEFINFNLRSSLGNILRTLAFRAAEKGLELAFRVPPDVPNAVAGDPGRLRQVIVNLVANAIKFTEKGEVVLSVTSEQENEDEACLHFAVADSGIGIPAAKQATIFDPFSQADPSTTRRYGGTGLGLTISTRLVEMMGGRIWVESAVGKGSTFHFTVRFGLQVGQPVRMVPEEPAYLEDLSILVVDDNTSNKQILEEMLRNWRMRPTTANSGQAALELMAAAKQSGEPFRLLLLDANMPGMDGFELVERIKEGHEENLAIIMMLTSVGQRGDASRCRQLGISAYLTKPLGQSSLLDAILTVLGKTVPESAGTPLVTIHSLREKQRPLRILLAEDNAINRKIAVRMLEKRGHAVIVAENGREAVAAIAAQGQSPFDLVLMDVQMPEMDGYEATALIRAEEKTGEWRLPIIALTAHAMEGDREKCLAAGMDGYVAKPLKADDLLAVIETVIKVQVETTQVVKGSRRAEEDAFDREEALERVDGDMELFREIVGIFTVDSPKLLAEVRDAIGSEDKIRLNRAAHTLKGAVANFSARPSFEAALKLEQLGKEGELIGAAEFFATLEEEIVRLQCSLVACSGEIDHENPDS